MKLELLAPAGDLSRSRPISSHRVRMNLSFSAPENPIFIVYPPYIVSVDNPDDPVG